MFRTSWQPVRKNQRKYFLLIQISKKGSESLATAYYLEKLMELLGILQINKLSKTIKKFCLYYYIII